jgi:hypothetical protein
MITHKAITFIVVGGLCTMALTYMGTLAACVIFGIEPKGDLMRSFEAAGMYILGAFTGILVNTRTHQPTSPKDGRVELNLTATSKEKENPDA